MCKEPYAHYNFSSCLRSLEDRFSYLYIFWCIFIFYIYFSCIYIYIYINFKKPWFVYLENQSNPFRPTPSFLVNIPFWYLIAYFSVFLVYQTDIMIYRPSQYSSSSAIFTSSWFIFLVFPSFVFVYNPCHSLSSLSITGSFWFNLF